MLAMKALRWIGCAAAVLWLACVVSAAGGCASAARAGESATTRLTAADLVEVADEMAQRLRASRFLADRSPASPAVVIAAERVQNLSDDILTEGERWWMVRRVSNALPMQELGRDLNVRFVLPARWAAEEGTAVSIDDRATPTHELTATIYGAARSGAAARSDAYLTEFRVTAANTGELVWAETLPIKRQAFGKLYD